MVTTEVRGAELCDTLFALHEEHLPPELHERARMLANDIVAVGSDAALDELARLYRALAALLPDHRPQIRAAYQATVFEDDRNDEDDWETFEKVGEE